MRIDLNRIPRDKPYVVHIPTPEHGRVFLEEMRARYPESVKTWSNAYFEKWRLESGGNYYYPRLHQEYPRLTHGDTDVYSDMGCSFLTFDEIMVPDIELETNIGDVPIESLFG